MEDQSLASVAPLIGQAARFNEDNVGRMEMWQRRARAFADRHIRPYAQEWDRRAAEDPHYFAKELIERAAEYELLSLPVPSPVGGAGEMVLESSLVCEEIAAACAGAASTIGAHYLGMLPPIVFGPPAVWEALREITREEKAGRPVLMGLAVTEPSAGSDTEDAELFRKARLGSRAHRVAGGFELHGTKIWTSNGSIARYLSVVMPLDLERPVETSACFLVDTRDPGFRVERVFRKMGHRICPTTKLVFDGVRVEPERLIGRVGDGVSAAILAVTLSRPAVGAIGVGIARGALACLQRWLQRAPEADGLLGEQHVQLALARMHEDIHLARHAYLEAAACTDALLASALESPAARALGWVPEGWWERDSVRRLFASTPLREANAALLRNVTTDEALSQAFGRSSMAKAHGGDVALRVSGEALEIAGLSAPDPVRAKLEKHWRDAKLTQIYEGTNQINRLTAYHGLIQGRTDPMLPQISSRLGHALERAFGMLHLA